MKKICLSVVILMLFAVPVLSQDKMEKLILAGPRAPVTPPLAYIVEAGLLDDLAEKVELILWKNPDQLRSIIMGKQAHIAATPSHMAAKLYNKGVPVKLMNISVWGDYWMISNDPRVKTINDLKGEEIAMPRRGGTPNTVFSLLTQRLDITLEDDFTIRYMPNFVAAMQEVVSGRVKHAFLSEPHASLAIAKSKGTENVLNRAVDIQSERGRLYNTKPRIPRAGICALPIINTRPDVIKAFQDAYRDAITWCKKNPAEAGRISAKYIPAFKAESVATSIKTGNLEFVSARDGKDEIEKFFKVLLSQNPAKVGGKLPDDGLYWPVRK